MNEANPRPGEAAARAADMNAPIPISSDTEAPVTPARHTPVSKLTMRVSLKAPTPGAGPAALAPDPRRDIIAPAPAPEPTALPAPMTPPLNINPVLGGQFGSMNEVTSSPAPILVRSAPSPQPPPVVTPVDRPAFQAPKKPAKVNRSSSILNAICILLGLVVIVLFAFMLME